MDVDALPEADELWWRFAILAALGISRLGDDRFSHDSDNQVLTYTDGSIQLSMQRLYNGRMVLWGKTGDAQATGEWAGIPGWATSDAVHDSLERAGATFLLWHARDGWESASTDQDLTSALAPLLDPDLDRDLIAEARGGSLDDERLAALGAVDVVLAHSVLKAAAGEAPPIQGTVRHLLALEIEAQMRRTRERDRLLPQRPVPLVRWTTVAKPPAGFSYAVRVSRAGLIRMNDFVPRLATESLRALTNVLEQLYVDETTPAGGSWLFARVRFNGVQAHLDRAFDSRPLWASQAPSLEELSAEMDRRDIAWRPAWASLLPPTPNHSGHTAIASPPGELMA
ncbi:MAG: hypothetical protein ACTHJM_00185 [Marmoricola sp.]